jgi:hypothetical protein
VRVIFFLGDSVVADSVLERGFFRGETCRAFPGEVFELSGSGEGTLMTSKGSMEVSLASAIGMLMPVTLKVAKRGGRG